MKKTKKKIKFHWATFNRFEFQMPPAAVRDCHHQGQCDFDVEFWASHIDLSKIDPDLIRKELKEYGAWDDSELRDEKTNRRRLIWIAAGNIQDEIKT